MNVERFLRKHGGPVFSVRPDTTVAELARRFGHLSEGRRFSLACVCDAGGQLLGVVSLGDIAHTLGQHEEKAPRMLVKDIMTQGVYACHPQDVLEDVLKHLAERGLRHAPVVEDGKLVGLVARRDALEFLYQWAQLDVDHLTEWLFSSHARY